MASQLVNCVLVAAGKYHDIDYARRELLAMLGTHQNVRTRVFEDYENLDALAASKLLISYTCDVIPSEPAQQAIQEWIVGGGRWLALHGTNTVLELLHDGRWHAPRTAPRFMQTLGSQFLSHPTIAPYKVENVAPDHPLVEGIDDFEVTDELYHMEIHEPVTRLLECQCDDTSSGFVEGDQSVGRHPVLYIKTHGEGEVVYFTLGHCRGHFDMQPIKDYWPSIDRGAWLVPEYIELVKRSIARLSKQTELQ